MLLVPEFGSNVYPSSARALAKLFGAAGIDVHWVSGDKAFAEFRSNDWVAPVLVILAANQAETSAIYAVIMGIISNYLSKIFFGTSQETTQARLKILGLNGDKFSVSEIDYSGSVEGIKALTEAVKVLKREETTNGEQKTLESAKEGHGQPVLPEEAKPRD